MSSTHGAPFRLATLARGAEPPFVAIVLDDRAIELRQAVAVLPASDATAALTAADGILGLLGDWDANFAALQAVVEVLAAEGLDGDRFAPHSFDPGQARTLPPVLRPSKIMCAAQNYPTHLEEMRAFQASAPQGDAKASENAAATPDVPMRPYLWLKAPSAMSGAYDDIELPSPESQIDWEVEMAVVIGRRARKVSSDDAMVHVAGFMTMNDVSRRDTLLRADRKGLRSDWFASKSLEGFAPMGPYFVPRAFVDHGNLRLHLSVNGETKQEGNTRDLIYGAEEQIEYASHVLGLEPGDVLATGTCGGVGQATNTFLAEGDLVEAEVEGLGALRNRFVAAAD